MMDAQDSRGGGVATRGGGVATAVVEHAEQQRAGRVYSILLVADALQSLEALGITVDPSRGADLSRPPSLRALVHT